MDQEMYQPSEILDRQIADENYKAFPIKRTALLWAARIIDK